MRKASLLAALNTFLMACNEVVNEELTETTPASDSETFSKKETSPSNVDSLHALEEVCTWLYETSRALGSIPFVSNRALEQFIDPVP